MSLAQSKWSEPLGILTDAHLQGSLAYLHVVYGRESVEKGDVGAYLIAVVE